MKNNNKEAINYVLMSASENNVKFIRLWFSDILGNLKGFAITIDELEDVMNNGASFDGSSIQASVRDTETDKVALPDPSTFEILPWRTKATVARIFCNILDSNGNPSDSDGRNILIKNLSEAKKLGFTFYVSPEMEYYYGRNENNFLDSSDQSEYFDQTSTEMIESDLRRDTVLTLEQMGIPVKHSHHEVSKGQHEIDLRHTDALTMADSIMTFKVVAKELANLSGINATFMPRPYNDRHGSGMHTHMSLFEGNKNLFFDDTLEYKLSKLGRQFIAGLIAHASEICVVTNQWVNSYKRLIPGLEAPTYSSWSTNNFGDLIRVPSFSSGKEDSLRVEYRAPDSSSNPYLLFSVLLASGLDGIKKQMKIENPIDLDINKLSNKELKKYGVIKLPETLKEAIDIAESSKLLKSSLGNNAFEILLNNKHQEWKNFSSYVTDYEISKYQNL
ncbi:MAG: glutamine synthetase [Chloroflexi bacterium]|nr:glutamine synthetase [Chloroflexota bacterium]